MHVFLWNGADIYNKFKSAVKQLDDPEDDIHNELMLSYPTIPDSFFVIFLTSLGMFQIIISQFTAFTMPTWSVVLCIFMSIASVLPIGVITAISGQRLGLNVLTEFVIGLLIPSQTIPVMAFKSLGTNSVRQSITLLADLKLGHYMKINPFHMVFAQMYGTLLGAIINTGCCYWVMDNMDHILGKGDWEMSDYFVFYNAGAIWYEKFNQGCNRTVKIFYRLQINTLVLPPWFIASNNTMAATQITSSKKLATDSCSTSCIILWPRKISEFLHYAPMCCLLLSALLFQTPPPMVEKV